MTKHIKSVLLAVSLTAFSCCLGCSDQKSPESQLGSTASGVQTASQSTESGAAGETTLTVSEFTYTTAESLTGAETSTSVLTAERTAVTDNAGNAVTGAAATEKTRTTQSVTKAAELTGASAQSVSSTTQTTTTGTTKQSGQTDLPLSPVDRNTELFGSYYEMATRQLRQMSLDEKVSQMFLASYPGYTTALKQASDTAPGGYILFAADFKNQTKASIRKQLNTLQSKSRYGLLLGADEEGGGIVRVSMYQAFRSTRFPSPQTLFKQGGLQAIYEDAAEKSALLKEIGLNYNLAPVVDMPQKTSSYIYGRTLGQDAETTAEYAAGVVNVMNSYDMIATLKHFPGYGDNLDTHSVISVDKRSKAEFESRDLLPFIRGIEAGVPMIMVNHNMINCMDSTKPASLSPEVHRVLRQELGFSGIIVTDGLTMGAIQKYATNGEAAVQAVLCGNDMIATTDYLNQKKQIIKAVKDGRIPEIMINDAVRRILACKYRYGVLH